MSVIPKNGTQKYWQLRLFKKTASTAYSINSIVDWPASPTGFFVAATSSTTKLCGLLQRAVTSASSDYATTTVWCPVLVPIAGPESTVIATTTGTAVATDVGGRYDLTDAVTVNRAASTVGRYEMTKFLTATLTEGYLLPTAIYGAAA
jgi:hypothetical protein